MDDLDLASSNLDLWIILRALWIITCTPSYILITRYSFSLTIPAIPSDRFLPCFRSFLGCTQCLGHMFRRNSRAIFNIWHFPLICSLRFACTSFTSLISSFKMVMSACNLSIISVRWWAWVLIHVSMFLLEISARNARFINWRVAGSSDGELVGKYGVWLLVFEEGAGI